VTKPRPPGFESSEENLSRLNEFPSSQFLAPFVEIGPTIHHHQMLPRNGRLEVGV